MQFKSERSLGVKIDPADTLSIVESGTPALSKPERRTESERRRYNCSVLTWDNGDRKKPELVKAI